MGRKNKRGPVTIMTITGRYKVEGEIYGIWAVTKFRNAYTVTHIPTGRRPGPWVFDHPNVPRRAAKVLAARFPAVGVDCEIGGRLVDDGAGTAGEGVRLLVAGMMGMSPSAWRD